MNDFIKILIGVTIICIASYLNELWIRKKAKKAKYNCTKCKVFDCPAKTCSKLYDSFESKENYERNITKIYKRYF